MKITQTNFDGLRILELNHHEDNRGYFTRYYCEETFKNLPKNYHKLIFLIQ